MKKENFNKNTFDVLLPELSNNPIKDRWYKYEKGGMAYFNGVDRGSSTWGNETIGINMSDDWISSVAWFYFGDTYSSHERAFCRYTLATESEIISMVKRSLKKKDIVFGKKIWFNGEIYLVTKDIEVYQNDVYLVVIKHATDPFTAIAEKLPIIVNGKFHFNTIKVL